MVNGKQITVQFFIDNLHISYESMSMIDGSTKDLNNIFKTNFQESVMNKGNVHDYLGITIIYSNKDYVKFTMYNFLEDVLNEAHPDMNGRSKWPATNKLFNTDTTSTKLATRDQDYFHCMVARLLFVAKWARPDIQVMVTFLCTRVSQQTQQDYNKLATVIKYLRETIHLPLLIW